MKNNRSLGDHEHLITKHKLNRNPPPPDSLFWKMWYAVGEPIAQKTLTTGFLEGIKNGNLDPNQYGAFSVSDIYYCFHGASDYGIAAKRTTNTVLQDYYLKKQDSYNRYNQSACTTWNLTGPESIAPTPTALDYSNFERSVANGTAQEGNVKDPIFTLIVMLPCEYLWAWLASQLAPPKPGNIYASWITSNNYPDGAYAMGNFLQDYITLNPINEDVATTIYQTATEYEYKNFYTATPEPT
ncbi:MAG: TenA family transcriptional regulator [Okeania sp. SIO3B5]|uniref:hypothetical protein n=1 Tax=Okeania sp. SIO3B5 TaxID=2607811 RepID=UPI0013FF6A9A|nr:hypothetical protein [Okeania sp. SIO3B5]NEO58885.1 TenA family transcriptional regulator [Okeania sp. SIO3B5]